jgi:hypothetical protein
VVRTAAGVLWYIRQQAYCGTYGSRLIVVHMAAGSTISLFDSIVHFIFLILIPKHLIVPHFEKFY